MPISENLDRLLNQIGQLAQNGSFGPEAQAASDEYAALPPGLSASAQYLADVYSGIDETSQHIDYFIQILVVAYRDAKKVDPDLAESFATALIADFPGTNATALLPRWANLAEACIGFRALGGTENRSLIWQHSSRLVLAMNEFLDGLLGYLILAWRRAGGRDANSNVLGNTYGSKVHEFAELTNGEDGAFYLFFRIANPKLRNGLAHSNAWPDYEAGVVRYPEGRQDKSEHALDIIEFMALVKFGCDLAKAYIGALAAILLLEAEEFGAVSGAREHLVNLWRG